MNENIKNRDFLEHRLIFAVETETTPTRTETETETKAENEIVQRTSSGKIEEYEIQKQEREKEATRLRTERKEIMKELQQKEKIEQNLRIPEKVEQFLDDAHDGGQKEKVILHQTIKKVMSTRQTGISEMQIANILMNAAGKRNDGFISSASNALGINEKGFDFNYENIIYQSPRALFNAVRKITPTSKTSATVDIGGISFNISDSGLENKFNSYISTLKGDKKEEETKRILDAIGTYNAGNLTALQLAQANTYFPVMKAIKDTIKILNQSIDESRGYSWGQSIQKFFGGTPKADDKPNYSSSFNCLSEKDFNDIRKDLKNLYIERSSQALQSKTIDVSPSSFSGKIKRSFLKGVKVDKSSDNFTYGVSVVNLQKNLSLNGEQLTNLVEGKPVDNENKKLVILENKVFALSFTNTKYSGNGKIKFSENFIGEMPNGYYVWKTEKDRGFSNEHSFETEKFNKYENNLERYSEVAQKLFYSVGHAKLDEYFSVTEDGTIVLNTDNEEIKKLLENNGKISDLGTDTLGEKAKVQAVIKEFIDLDWDSKVDQLQQDTRSKIWLLGPLVDWVYGRKRAVTAEEYETNGAMDKYGTSESEMETILTKVYEAKFAGNLPEFKKFLQAISDYGKNVLTSSKEGKAKYGGEYAKLGNDPEDKRKKVALGMVAAFESAGALSNIDGNMDPVTAIYKLYEKQTGKTVKGVDTNTEFNNTIETMKNGKKAVALLERARKMYKNLDIKDENNPFILGSTGWEFTMSTTGKFKRDIPLPKDEYGKIQEGKSTKIYGDWVNDGEARINVTKINETLDEVSKHFTGKETIINVENNSGPVIINGTSYNITTTGVDTTTYYSQTNSETITIRKDGIITYRKGETFLTRTEQDEKRTVTIKTPRTQVVRTYRKTNDKNEWSVAVSARKVIGKEEFDGGNFEAGVTFRAQSHRDGYGDLHNMGYVGFDANGTAELFNSAGLKIGVSAGVQKNFAWREGGKFSWSPTQAALGLNIESESGLGIQGGFKKQDFTQWEKFFNDEGLQTFLKLTYKGDKYKYHLGTFKNEQGFGITSGFEMNQEEKQRILTRGIENSLTQNDITRLADSLYGNGFYNGLDTSLQTKLGLVMKQMFADKNVDKEFKGRFLGMGASANGLTFALFLKFSYGADILKHIKYKDNSPEALNRMNAIFNGLENGIDNYRVNAKDILIKPENASNNHALVSKEDFLSVTAGDSAQKLKLSVYISDEYKDMITVNPKDGTFKYKKVEVKNNAKNAQITLDPKNPAHFKYYPTPKIVESIVDGHVHREIYFGNIIDAKYNSSNKFTTEYSSGDVDNLQMQKVTINEGVRATEQVVPEHLQVTKVKEIARYRYTKLSNAKRELEKYWDKGKKQKKEIGAAWLVFRKLSGDTNYTEDAKKLLNMSDDEVKESKLIKDLMTEAKPIMNKLETMINNSNRKIDYFDAQTLILDIIMQRSRLDTKIKKKGWKEAIKEKKEFAENNKKVWEKTIDGYIKVAKDDKRTNLANHLKTLKNVNIALKNATGNKEQEAKIYSGVYGFMMTIPDKGKKPATHADLAMSFAKIILPKVQVIPESDGRKTRVITGYYDRCGNAMLALQDITPAEVVKDKQAYKLYGGGKTVSLGARIKEMNLQLGVSLTNPIVTSESFVRQLADRVEKDEETRTQVSESTHTEYSELQKAFYEDVKSRREWTERWTKVDTELFEPETQGSLAGGPNGAEQNQTGDTGGDMNTNANGGGNTAKKNNDTSLIDNQSSGSL